MSDISVENYKKSVARIVEIWGQEADKVAKELRPIEDELEKLEANQNPGLDDKKRIEELKKKCATLHKRMDDATTDLRVNLMVIEVPPKAPEEELVKIPAWLKEIIKKKGIPLGGSVSIAPDVQFDFKKKALKHLGVIIRW